MGFGLLLIIFVLQEWISNREMDSTINSFNDYQLSIDEAYTILNIKNNITELQRSVLAYTYTGYEGVIRRVKRIQNHLKEQLAKAIAASSDKKYSTILNRITQHFNSYVSQFDSAINERTTRDELIEKKMNVIGKLLSHHLSLIINKALQQENHKIAALAGLAQEKVLFTHRDALTFINSPDSSLVRSAKQNVRRFIEIANQLTSHIQDPKNKSLSEEIVTLAPKYEQAFLGVVHATRGYLHLVNVVMAGEAAEIGRLATELKNITLTTQNNIKTQMLTTANEAKFTALNVSLFATLLGLILAGLITRNIANPIKKMTTTLSELSRGNKEAKIPGRGRHDEIGAMAQAAEVFKQKAIDLENASQYKSEFLANMSHELRTPLNSLLILSKLFANNEAGNLSEDQIESATIIYESGSYLLRLINDVLDLSKVEAGRMEVVPETFYFDTFGQSIKRQFQAIAENKGLALIIHLDARIPSQIKTDWNKVEQIIRNFLSNAFKFTETGQIALTIALPDNHTTFKNPQLTYQNTISIAVSDTGIGIPDDKKDQIFEAFRQVDGTSSRKYGGTGLGLSISTKFAQILGGEIQLNSHHQQGSTFTLLLPVEFPPHLETKADKTDITPPLHVTKEGQSSITYLKKNAIVLIADDDDRNIYALRKMLEPKVKQVIIAQDGQQAIDQLKHHPEINLVLMDIMMPNINGYEVIKTIRQQKQHQQLPIITLTAKVMPGDKERCLDVGANDYIAKPVTEEKLLPMMASWLKQRPSNCKANNLSVSNNSSNLQQAKIMLVDDDMRNIFTLAKILEPKVKQLILASDGIIAIENLKNHPDIDLILLDMIMPNMDGFQTLQTIREKLQNQTLPIVALTAKIMPGDKESCLQAGANDYIPKPVDTDQLLELIYNYINVKEFNNKHTQDTQSIHS